MNFTVSEIEVYKTYPLRQTLLRKGKPLSSCHLDQDEAKETLHFGAFLSDQIIGILSAFQNPCPQYSTPKGVQLRAIAVTPIHQRKGVATLLIKSAVQHINEKFNPDCIWLNARISANSLYESNGFSPLDNPFEIKSIGTHQCFIKILSNET